jgi:hypothetical protein
MTTRAELKKKLERDFVDSWKVWDDAVKACDAAWKVCKDDYTKDAWKVYDAAYKEHDAAMKACGDAWKVYDAAMKALCEFLCEEQNDN